MSKKRVIRIDTINEKGELESMGALVFDEVVFDIFIGRLPFGVKFFAAGEDYWKEKVDDKELRGSTSGEGVSS